ncbi:MAG: hypothetical protein NZ610_07530 [Candidatus Bipolaricaulota bacterium]|nr:hypothetical protein [Candidatus Bipolaricaulota bacterium]MCS7275229.1 hypothetical protein [Candidatus Bipolaricaulota bacterium]MDW8111069.1 hypothetical protein [Candidatus Bipolaricaulota bacterium]MDW8329560.1 hypothetical protein [Candidatus Bipolaricaulota bacterium]
MRPIILGLVLGLWLFSWGRAPADELIGPFDLLIELTGETQSAGQLGVRLQNYEQQVQEEQIELAAGERPETILAKLLVVLQETLAIHDRHLQFFGKQLLVQEFFSKEFYSQSVLVLWAVVPGVAIKMRARSRDTAFLTTAFFTERAYAPGRIQIRLLPYQHEPRPTEFALDVAPYQPGEALWELFSQQMRAVGWISVVVPVWGVVVTNLTTEDSVEASTDAVGLGVGLYRLDPESVLYPFGCDNCNQRSNGGG